MGAKKALASPLEFFETPREALTPLLQYLQKPKIWVDLGCGRGALGRGLSDHFGTKGIGVEFLPERAERAMASGAYMHVLRGDLADAELRRTLFDLTLMNADAEMSGVLVVANPPFQQWELFERVARELTASSEWNEVALLLPAMAFEKRKTHSTRYKERAAAIREASGRYDLASRPAFFRQFVGTDGKTRFAQKGEAPSAYAWLVVGTSHKGRWRWLESEAG